jgi:hypothetical protein
MVLYCHACLFGSASKQPLQVIEREYRIIFLIELANSR